MHMADALLSPAVAACWWAASATLLTVAARRLQGDTRPDLAPMMGVLAAFVFAAQMINFTIPATGSSGHIGGGLLLSILLGPNAALIALASVLTVQALFFADGGLLALGANVFNVGVCACCVAYPLIYRPLMRRAGPSPTRRQVVWITTLATVLGLQLGAMGVVVETQLSGISSLPLTTFLFLMQPIHLAIGLVEGLATATLIVFLREARSDLFACEDRQSCATKRARLSARTLAGFGTLALLMAGVLSWFASSQPDGLEWSIARATGQTKVIPASATVHLQLGALQAKTAVFPHYARPKADALAPPAAAAAPAWPGIDSERTLAGVVGGVTTLLLVLLLGWVIRRRQRVVLHGQP